MYVNCPVTRASIQGKMQSAFTVRNYPVALQELRQSEIEKVVRKPIEGKRRRLVSLAPSACTCQPGNLPDAFLLSLARQATDHLSPGSASLLCCGFFDFQFPAKETRRCGMGRPADMNVQLRVTADTFAYMSVLRVPFTSADLVKSTIRPR